MKIGFCSLDWSNILGADGYPTPGGAGWYRCVLPARTLAQNGVDTVYGPFLYGAKDGIIGLREWGDNPDGTGGTEHGDCDVIVIQRWMGADAAKLIYAARATGQIIVNDVDDWFEGIPPRNAAWRSAQPHPGISRRNLRSIADPTVRAQFNNADNINNYRKAISASSALTVSTPYLRDRYQKMHPELPVFLIPNALDVDRWKVRDAAKKIITVGWVGATTNRSGDLEILTGTLNRWLEQNKARFFHGGANWETMEGFGPLGLDPKRVRYTSLPMASIEKYPNFFGKFNIGIVPLSSVPFNEAKSAIKGMEMSASGLPFIASRLPAYQELYERGAGECADNPKGWLKRLDGLRDPARRAELGRINREVVEQHYNMKDNWVNWRNAYQRMNP